MCRVLRVQRSGFYAWLRVPLSKRAKDSRRLTGLIKQAWLESGCVYGYHKIHDDLRCLGESLSLNRTARLMRDAELKAQIGYKRKLGSYGGSPAIVANTMTVHQFAALIASGCQRG